MRPATRVWSVGKAPEKHPSGAKVLGHFAAFTAPFGRLRAGSNPCPFKSADSLRIPNFYFGRGAEGPVRA